MARGGARSNSGPPPDPDALRRDRKTDGEWVVLPASGRTGAAPTWPFELSKAREIDVWTDLWSTPQAIEWERLGQEHLVGLYVRRMVEAEEWGSAVNLSTLVRQMADGLGLTTPGLRSNRWRIEAEAPAPTKTKPKRPPSKARLRVVAADAVDGTEPAG